MFFKLGFEFIGFNLFTVSSSITNKISLNILNKKLYIPGCVHISCATVDVIFTKAVVFVNIVTVVRIDFGISVVESCSIVDDLDKFGANVKTILDTVDVKSSVLFIVLFLKYT